MLTRSRNIEFYEHGCEKGTKPATGTMTLSGEDGEPQGCEGGPLHPSGSDTSSSIGVNGISGSGLVVEVYAEDGCPPESKSAEIAGDDCFAMPIEVGCHDSNA